MIRGIAQRFTGKFEEKTAGFFRVGGRIGSVPGTFSFARTAERGRRRERTGGFRRGFFERATGGHERVWREKGFERKEKFFWKGPFCQRSVLNDYARAVKDKRHYQ